MLRIRVIPCLLLKGRGLVKTVRFRSPSYVGDPINIVRIFNELEVDELVFLDIEATPGSREIQARLLQEIASECFMPFTYGGGIRTVEDAQRVFELGAEKVVINSWLFEDPDLVGRIARIYGSQAVVAAVDAGRDIFGRYRVFSRSGRRRHPFEPVAWARRMEEAGAGEILLTAIHREGTFSGYDIPLIRAVSEAVTIPVIANGGASRVEDFRTAVVEGGASAVATGSMVVYQGPNRAVLTNFPERETLVRVFEGLS